jgi:hypothetical protein
MRHHCLSGPGDGRRAQSLQRPPPLKRSSFRVSAPPEWPATLAIIRAFVDDGTSDPRKTHDDVAEAWTRLDEWTLLCGGQSRKTFTASHSVGGAEQPLVVFSTSVLDKSPERFETRMMS